MDSSIFTKNIGTPARVARAVMGIILVSFAIILQSMLLMALGLFCLAQAIFSWCALRALMGKPSSCALKERAAGPPPAKTEE